MWPYALVNLPVKKNVAYIAVRFLLAVHLLLGFQSPIFAQSNVGYNRITSAKEGVGNRTVTLTTAHRTAIPSPAVSFLPGENGDTILVADFPGLLWQLPTKVIQVNSSFVRLPGTTSNTRKKGIKLVRIGQFQESPAIMRISIVASDPEKLKTVSFNSGPGKLKISWSKWLSGPKQHISAAPSHKERNIGEIAQAPPLAPPIGALDPNLAQTGPQLKPPIGMAAEPAQSLESPKPKEKKGLLSRWFKKAKKTVSSEPEPAPPIVKNAPQEAKKPASEARPNLVAGDSAAPIITLSDTGNDSFVLEIKHPSKTKLSYKAFRLHNPERYVVDFENLEEIALSTVPPHKSKNVNAIRVGAPFAKDPSNKTGRLVFDLGQKYVDIEAYEPDKLNGNIVAFQVGLSKDSLAGLSVPKGTVVVLDAGHGGGDPGAQRANLNEKDITLAIVKKTEKHLSRKGIKTILTRDKDEKLALAERVALTNKHQPDVFLSVHVNSLETKSDIHGIETYYQTPQSLTLAKRIHKSLVDGLDAPDRSVRQAKFYVVNRTTVPAVLAEVGFISHKEERTKLATDAYQEKVALALAKGVILHINQGGMIADSKKVERISNNSVTSPSKLSKSQGQTEDKRGTISTLSRLAQKGLGFNTK